jgi:hypothetical protein
MFAIYSPPALYLLMTMSLKLCLVSCDLREPGCDYASLKEHVRVLNATRVMATAWALRSTRTAAELKDIIRPVHR